MSAGRHDAVRRNVVIEGDESGAPEVLLRQTVEVINDRSRVQVNGDRSLNQGSHCLSVGSDTAWA